MAIFSTGERRWLADFLKLPNVIEPSAFIECLERVQVSTSTSTAGKNVDSKKVTIFLFCCLWIPLNGGHSRSTKPLRYFRYFLKPRLTTTLTYLFSIILAGKKLRTEKADSFPKPRKNGASRWEKQKSKKIVNLAIIDFIFVLFSGLPSSVWPEF